MCYGEFKKRQRLVQTQETGNGADLTFTISSDILVKVTRLSTIVDDANTHP